MHQRIKPATTVGVLLLVLFSAEVEGGQLSRARGAARHTESAAAPTAASPAPAASGKLSRAREAARGPAPSDSHNEPHDAPPQGGHGRPSRDRHHGHYAVRNGNPWGGLFTLSTGTFGWCHEPIGPPPVVVLPAYTTPPPTIYVEPPAVQYQPTPPVFQTATRQFAAYPFANGSDGFFDNNGNGKPWLGKLQFELGPAGEDVSRTGIAFLLEGDQGFGIDFDWDSYTEELPAGEHDELHLGQVNLMYRVAETDDALIRAGIGVGWLGDAYGTEAGLNLTMQADVLLTENWTASADLDFGTLGDAETLHASGTIGRRFGLAEVYAGYDYRRIGEVDLQGPTVGLRLWW